MWARRLPSVADEQDTAVVLGGSWNARPADRANGSHRHGINRVLRRLD
jgi:hypothetical protein